MVAKKKRDWLEPPEWWKKFRPLRLAVIGLLGYGVYSWLDLGQQAVVALQKPHEATVSYTAVLANPVDLITPLHSYSSVADVEAERPSIWTRPSRSTSSCRKETASTLNGFGSRVILTRPSFSI